MIRALVVDDNVENQELLGQDLTDLNIPFKCAGSIEEAVDLGLNETFDFILMDLQIPRRQDNDPVFLGGLEAAKLILACKPGIPILAVTNSRKHEVEKKILDAGLAGPMMRSSF